MIMNPYSDLIKTQYSDFSRIILMVADDMACNPRNPRPGKKRHYSFN